MPSDPRDEVRAETADFTPEARRSASSLSRFLELRLHARGGLGEVYEAWNAEFRRPVALKFLKTEKSGDGESRDRFRGEAEITGRLEHPGIVPIYGLGEDDAGHPCYAMRFIRGLPMDEAIRALHDADAEPDTSKRDASLADLLARIKGTRRGPSATASDLRDRVFRELLGRFRAVCETVAYAHSKRVIHRDLKPQNVMLGKFGETLVVDWGLARPFDAPESGSGRAGPGDAETTMPIDTPSGGLTPTVGPKGTPSYMSPEQASARSDVGPATDVYGLGATLYSLLAGHAPFLGRADEVLEQVRDGAFPPPRSVKPSVPRPLEAVCLKAMARDPSRRYASAGALADDVDNWLNDRPVAAWREPWSVRAGRWMKRHRTSVTASAAALLVGLATVGAVTWRARSERLRVEADAKASIDVAERLAADSLNDVAKWAAASAAAERAKGLLDSSGLGGESRRRVDAALALLKSQERDRAMVHDLEEARLAGAAGGKREGEFDPGAQSAACLHAFRAYGIDLEALPAGEAARLVRASAIRDNLVATIDDLASLPGAGGPPPERLLALARAVDDDPDRGAIRDAVARRDRAALLELALGIDVHTAKAGHLGSLARSLNHLGEIAAARELCGRAQEIYTEDFWINFELGRNYLRSSPPRFDQAARYFTAAVALRPRSPAAHNHLASALGAQGDFAGAEAAHRRAIALKPDYTGAYGGLGLTLLGRRDLKGAETALRRAIELQPDWFEGHDSLGIILHDRGDLAGAEASYRRAIAIKPNNALANEHLGTTLRDRGDLEGAVASYRRVIALKPDDVAGYLGLSALLRGRGDMAGAEAALRDAVGRNPENADAYVHLGITLRDRGDLPGAEAEHRRAVALRPDSQWAHVHLGITLLGRGDTAGAEAAYRRAVAISPNYADAHGGLANIFRTRGDLAAAEAEFRRVAEIQPENAEIRLGLGDVLRERGDLAGAEAEVLRATELKPDHIEARRRLTDIRRVRKLEEAEAERRRAVALEPDDSEAHRLLGGVLRERGDLAGAEAAHRRAVALKPGDSEAHFQLAYTLRANGDVAGAEAAYRRVVALKPDSSGAHNNLGLILFGRGDFAGAEAAYRRAIELKPNNVFPHNNLGDVLRNRGDLAGAEAAYRRAAALKPDDADFQYSLGYNLQKLGRLPEALVAYRRAHKLGSKRPDWGRPSAEVIRHCEQLIALEPRLPKVLSGEDRPKDAVEAIDCAGLCYWARRNGASARLYEEAFADHPQLVDDFNLHRYNAACAAALAGVGQGEDAATLDDAARARWRKVALGWLRDELAGWVRRPDGATPQARAPVRLRFDHWRNDSDLVGIREPEALAKLPEAERAEWRKLWSEVDALIKRASEPAAK